MLSNLDLEADSPEPASPEIVTKEISWQFTVSRRATEEEKQIGLNTFGGKKRTTLFTRETVRLYQEEDYISTLTERVVKSIEFSPEWDQWETCFFKVHILQHEGANPPDPKKRVLLKESIRFAKEYNRLTMRMLWEMIIAVPETARKSRQEAIKKKVECTVTWGYLF